jgi:hypothetical protein
MSCVLRISGTFRTDDLVLEGALAPYRCWQAGEERGRGEKHTDTGLAIDVSAKGFDDFEGQLSDATAFLRAHQDRIRAVTDRADVEDATLDFGLAAPPHVASFRRIPADVVALAGACGLAVELSSYAVERDKGPDDPTRPNKSE